MVTVLNESDRIFQAWGSVEVVDNDGDYIPMEELKPVMITLMKRGGQIIDGHSNRVVGKILNYDFKEKEVGGESVPGILLTCQIYDDYQTDDEVWDDIKSGQATGMSFGGKTRKREFKTIKGQPARVLKNIEAFEYTVVRPGHEPVNPEASLVAANMVAKAKPSGDEAYWAWQCQVTGVCDKEMKVLKAMEVNKGEAYDRCVEGLKNDPDFKPTEGKTKEEAAHAICTESVGKEQSETDESTLENNELKKGSEVIIKEAVKGTVTEVLKEGLIVKSKIDGQHYFIKKTD